MHCSPGRRVRLGALALTALLPLTACGTGDSPAPSSPADGKERSVSGKFRKLEKKFDAHLGIYAVDTRTGQKVTYHSDKRFAYASSHKALTAGAVLRKYSDKEMEKTVTYDKDDLVSHSPVTKKHVSDGMTLRELCDAALRYSDNTAANLLLDSVGGTKGLDAELDRMGDHVTRVKDPEPLLNAWSPGEVDNTSSPRALADDLRTYLLRDTLNERDRKQLRTWLRTNTTGATLIKAGVPESWEVDDKSGGTDYGVRNDIAVVRPPHSAPLALAIMSHRDSKTAEYDDKLIAQAASVVAKELS
jgi:beta-lactamase class A